MKQLFKDIWGQAKQEWIALTVLAVTCALLVGLYFYLGSQGPTPEEWDSSTYDGPGYYVNHDEPRVIYITLDLESGESTVSDNPPPEPLSWEREYMIREYEIEGDYVDVLEYEFPGVVAYTIGNPPLTLFEASGVGEADFVLFELRLFEMLPHAKVTNTTTIREDK